MNAQRYVFFLILNLSFSLSWGQNDSLWSLLNNESTTDVLKAEIEYGIASNYLDENKYDSALKYSSMSMAFFNESGSEEQIIRNLWLQSTILKELGFESQFINTHQLLIQHLIKTKDSVQLAGAFDRIGMFYYKVKAIDSAIYYYNKAYEIGKLNKDEKALMDSYNNISQVYAYQGNYKKEQEYLYNGLALATKRKDDYGKATFYHNLALSYVNVEQYDKAMEAISNAIDINTYLNKINRIALNKTALGNIYAMQGDIRTALRYFNEALQSYTQSGNLFGQTEANYNIGYSYYYLKKYTSAQKYYFEALRTAKIINLAYYEEYIYDGLSEIYYEQSNYKKALSYYKKTQHIHDSLQDRTNNKLISTIQSEYEFERNQNQIKLLSKENELKHKQVENIIVLASVSVFSLIIVIILTLFIYRKLRKNKELAKQLKEQNTAIQNKYNNLKVFETQINNDLLYIKQLQTSFYRDTSNFKELFNDFYFKSFTTQPLENAFLWSTKTKNKLYWAIITINHQQLRGAFTGMYIYNMLNCVFHNKRFSNVDSLVNTFITNSFLTNKEQDFGKNQILFCALDKIKSELEFINIGVNVVLIRNAKVYGFDPQQTYININDYKKGLTNNIQLQTDDELVFFSENWTAGNHTISAVSTLHEEIISTKKQKYSDIFKDLEKDKDVSDFVFLSLRK